MTPSKQDGLVNEQMQAMTNINRRKCHRTVPVKVLCFGLSRTGTLSLREALKTLNFNDTYHFQSLALENPPDCSMWNDAFRAKFEPHLYPGLSFTTENWDQLLGHCMAITDSPAVFFYEELMDAYPDTKIILTTRDVDSYYKSFMKTLWPFGMRFCVPTWNPLRWIYRALLPRSDFLEMNRLLYKYGHGFDFDKTGKERYLRHNDAVRGSVKKRDRELLEYNLKEGWQPLCEYLGQEIPKVPFPETNSTSNFNQKWEPAVNALTRVVAIKLSGILVLGIVGVAAAYWGWGRK